MKQTIGILRNSKSKILEHENREFDLSSERRRSTNSTSSSVSFENITIREYAVCIGDNPSCSSGAPISIDWNYEEKATVPVELYEQHKPPRRSGAELKMPSNIRIDILQEWNYSLSKIMMASKESQELRKLRSKSTQKAFRRQIMKHNIISILKAPKKLINKAKSAREQGLAPVTSNGARSMEVPIVDDGDTPEASMDGSGSDDDVACGSIEHVDALSITHHRHLCLEL